MENLTENKVLELFEHFENHIAVHDDENELVLWRNNTWGIPETFAVQFNGKFLKTAKTLKTALKFFNSMVEKYNLSTELILEEYNLENQNFKTMEHYKKIQNEILERAIKVSACEEEYEKAQEAKDFNELLKVVTDNFHYCCNNRIIDSTLLAEIGAEICQENNLYFNVSIGGNAFLLVDSATVKAWGSATVKAWGSATVEASGSATVEASGSATVKAWGSATVKAWGSATVRAWGSATVEAWGSATVRASGSATVRAWDSATVRAWDSATVEASGSATVRASGSATVRARDSATVEAWDSAYVNAYTETIEHKISDKAILRYYYSGTVLLSENLTLKNS